MKLRKPPKPSFLPRSSLALLAQMLFDCDMLREYFNILTYQKGGKTMEIEKEYLARYAELFCHRRDIYAIQKTDGSYFLVRAPITLDLLCQHLAGELTCGWYGLALDNTIRWVALDADEEDGQMTLQNIWERLQELNIQAYLENSRRGGHLWVLVESISALVMRTLMKQVLDWLEVSEIEIYPRQDEIPTGGVGSLIRGPLGVHRLSGERYFFLDPVRLTPVGSSLTDQLDYLMTFEVNSMHRVDETLAMLIAQAPEPNQPQDKPAQTGVMVGEDRVEALKAAIGDVYAFVSQYVQLDAKGRGSCPFHPPDRHPSFAVNREEGYWVCFHETNPDTGRFLGGDAIEFYRRLKGLRFKQAMRELAEQYGVTDLLSW
jgi:hypothetical protein